MPVYEIHLASFDGPFDLLLHLIQKNEVDIYDIPIAEITEQYMAYLAAMEEMDLDIASEFLVMAATLLSIKARMLLPKPSPELLDEDEDYDPRLGLVHDLLEYKRIKEAAAALDSFYQARQRQFARPNEEAMYRTMFRDVNPLDGKTVADLLAAFQPVWQRAKSSGQIHTIQREAVSISVMTERIVEKLRGRPEGVRFEEIFTGAASRLQVIVGFMALLELTKLQALRLQQDDADAAIYILPVDLSLCIGQGDGQAE